METKINMRASIHCCGLALLVLAGALSSGCREDDPLPAPSAAPGVECIDDDGDGFGVGCAAGSDCDDNDPLVFDECPLPGDPPPGQCADGTTRACKITLPEHNGVKACFEGVETCENGAWAVCLKKKN